MRRTLLALLTVACLCALYTVAFAAARPTARLTAGTSLHTKTIAKGRKLHPGVTLTAPATIHGQTIKRYQWVRCNIKGRSCTRIKGATRRTYRLTRKDIGHTLIVRMVVGTTIVSSTPTATVGAALAVNTTAPAIADITSGSTQSVTTGDVLHGTLGAWTGAAGYSWAWQHCTASDSCSTVASGGPTPNAQTIPTYTVQSSDVGDTIVLVVTAFNTAQ